jgi:hypothetical protein
MKLNYFKSQLILLFIISFQFVCENSIGIVSQPIQTMPLNQKRGRSLQWFDEVRNDDYTWIGQSNPTQAQLDEQYEYFLNSQLGFGLEPFGKTLPNDHTITKYLQRILAWADRSARILYKKETGNDLKAPPPIAKVLQSTTTFNAFVSPVTVCTDIAFGENPLAGIGVFLQSDSVVEKLLEVPSLKARSCITKPPTWHTEGLLDFWQGGRHTPNCALQIISQPNEESQVVVKDKSTCPGAARGTQTIVKSTSQFIHFSSELVSKIDDPRVLFYLVTHELGHYYLGHSTDSGAARYNYWYLRANHKYGKPARKKQAEKNDSYLEEAYIYQEAVAKGQTVTNLDPLKIGFSDRLQNFLILGVGAILRELELKNSQVVSSIAINKQFDKICSAAAAKLPVNYQLNPTAVETPELIEVYTEDSTVSEGSITRDWVTPILNNNATEDDKQLFKEYQSLLSNCAKSLFAEGEQAILTTKPFALMFKKYLKNAKSIPENFFENQSNLFQILQLADQEAKKVDRLVFRLLPTAKQNILGFYTTEQAADEFALKIATLGGMSPDDVLEGVFGFMKATEIFLGKKKTDRLRKLNMELDYSACYQAYIDSKTPGKNTGFNMQREGDFISLGKLSDKHHSDCYRAFNLWRLIQVDRDIERASLGLIIDKQVLLKLPVERFFNVDLIRFNDELKPLFEAWQQVHNEAN